MQKLGAYVHREKLCNSLEGRPVELLTVSGSAGKSDMRQPAIPGFKPEGLRPNIFPGRQAVFLSARVHPGETPSSYVLEGMLKALAGSRRSLDAAALLQRYVFFIIPVLNPDGVAMGHHRTDSRGVNLNRMYGQGDMAQHAPILAAEGACHVAHQWQGGIRLYLDLHAHGSRRGCFTFGNDGEECLTARSRLFCYALARRCPIFEYSQSVFTHNSEGTGKSVMSATMGKALCFTLETNYWRGHHSTEPYTPAAWWDLGAACLEALCDLDNLESCNGPQAPLKQPNGEASPQPLAPAVAQRTPLEAEMASAAAWLLSACSAWAASGSPPPGLTVDGPSRACPQFAIIRTPSEGYSPSQELWRHVECFGQAVELVSRSVGAEDCISYKAELPGGVSLWVRDRDLIMLESLSGRFFYRVIQDTVVTQGPEPSSPVLHNLRVGSLLEASERRVVGGCLRVLIVGNDGGFQATGGWASEHRSLAFDPRLGGDVQLMRLRSLPGSRQDC